MLSISGIPKVVIAEVKVKLKVFFIWFVTEIVSNLFDRVVSISEVFLKGSRCSKQFSRTEAQYPEQGFNKKLTSMDGTFAG